MPKSKRSKVVSLTKVKKKGKDHKENHIDEIREASGKFKAALLISVENERNEFMKEVRRKLHPGRLFYGKNKLMQHSLGMSPECECQDNIHKLAQRISGHSAILFTDSPTNKVREFLEEYRPSDFARSGAIATETVVLPAGPDALANQPHSIEAHLRKIGLPTQLQNGKVILLGKHTVCKEGKEITSDQAQVLKLIEKKMANFQMTILAKWTKESGTFEKFAELGEDDDDDDDDDDMDDDEEGEEEEDEDMVD
jgi:mRNA turnover protein 4